MDAIIWASFSTNSCLIRKFSSRAFNSSLVRSSSRAISIFFLCTSSIFARCSISFSCLSLASAIVALRDAMSPSSCTLFCRKDSDELREDEREDLRLDLSETLLVLVDCEIIELFKSCSCFKKLIRSLTILRVSLFSREKHQILRTSGFSLPHLLLRPLMPRVTRTIASFSFQYLRPLP